LRFLTNVLDSVTSRGRWKLWHDKRHLDTSNPLIHLLAEELWLKFGPDTAIYIHYLLFSITTVIIVMVKNTPGHCEESLIASITVRMNTTTSTNMLHTIRVVKLPLKWNEERHCSFQYTETNTVILINISFTYHPTIWHYTIYEITKAQSNKRDKSIFQYRKTSV
jgi:hypothetical protein